MYAHALSRESYRIAGEYRVTKTDFMQATDFDDKVCNVFNYIDMHSREKGVRGNLSRVQASRPDGAFVALDNSGAFLSAFAEDHGFTRGIHMRSRI